MPNNRSQCKKETGDSPFRGWLARWGQSPLSYEIALLLLALALRFWRLGKQSLWIDEAFSVWLASHSLHQMLQIIAIDAHPPLFYALLHFWMRWGGSEAFLRLPFTLISGLNAVLVYRLGLQCFNRKTAIVASLFWAVSFPMLDAETQVRMYGMATALSLLATLLFLDAFRAATVSRWIPYVLVAGFCLYTHYYTAFILAAHLLFLTFHKRWREFTWLSLALTAVFSPWNSIFFNQLFLRFRNPAAAFRLNSPEYSILSGMLGIDNFLKNRQTNWAISTVIFILLVWVMIHLWRQKKQESRLMILILLFSAALPLGLAVTHRLNDFSARYAILFAAYFYLFFFYGFCKLPRALILPVFASLVFVSLTLWGFSTTRVTYERQNWRETSALLQHYVKPNDDLFFNDIMLLFPCWYYLPNHFDILFFPQDYLFEIVPNPRFKNLWIPVELGASETTLTQYYRTSKREWLILFQDRVFDPKERLRFFFFRHGWLTSYAKLQSLKEDNRIEIYLFKPKN